MRYKGESASSQVKRVRHLRLVDGGDYLAKVPVNISRTRMLDASDFASPHGDQQKNLNESQLQQNAVLQLVADFQLYLLH